MGLTTYTFDIKLLATIRVKAESATAATKKLRANLECADSNFGAWDDSGDPILGEASIDGDVDLIEIEGEAV